MSETVVAARPYTRFAAVVGPLVVEGKELSLRQLGVLFTIAETDNTLSIGDVATKLNVEKPVVTRALDLLEALELVDRLPSKDDGRLRVLKLTGAGKKYLTKLDKIVAKAGV